jgi:hypothetical protein
MSSVNQQNPPRSKKEQVDKQGNVRRKWGAKNKDGTTMPLIEGLTKPECKILEEMIREAIDGFNKKTKNIKILVNFVDW